MFIINPLVTFSKSGFLYSKFFVYICFKHWKILFVFLCLFFLSVYLFGFIITFGILIASVAYYVYTLCDYILYNPNLPKDSRENINTPNKYGVEYEDHFINTEDNVKIHVQLLKHSSQNNAHSCPTFIYFHGNAGNIGHRLINAIELYNNVKCNILLVEYRGYGRSEGKPTESGLYKDAYAALKFLYNRDDICSSKIVLFGRSLGGAVVIGITYLLFNSFKLSDVKPSALIIENTFTSVPDISRHLFSGGSKRLLARLFRMLPDWFYKSRYNSFKKISKIPLPTLFISGLSDELIPPKMMTKMFNICSSKHKELHRFESGTHNFTWKSPDYYSVIESFLETIFKESAIPSDLSEAIEYQLPEVTNEKSPLISSEFANFTPTVPYKSNHIVAFHQWRQTNNGTNCGLNNIPTMEPKFTSILINQDEIIDI